MYFTTRPTIIAPETTHDRLRLYLDLLDDFTNKRSLQCLFKVAHLVKSQQRILATNDS